MNSRLQFLVQAAPLMLVVFIDSTGLGLIIPVLNGLIFNPDSHFLSGYFAMPLMQNVVYGTILGVFMLAWFFGSAVLGDLSDKIGRKKSLLICLAGAFVSYLISALAVTLHSVSLLLLGRIINGLTAGSQPIAQAAVIDLSQREHKARNMSYMFLAMSMGFILGPLLGGLLSDPKLISWFNFATPFYFASAIAAINMWMLWLFFKETFVQKSQKTALRFSGAIGLFSSAFKHPKVKKMAIQYTVFIFGWASFYSFISAFLMKTYEFGSTQVSFYMGAMGLGFAIGNGFVVEFISARLTNVQIYFLASVGAALISLLTVIIPTPMAAWLLIVPMAACIAATGPTVMTLFSEQVDPDSQGWVMGVVGSIMALVWAINGVLVGAIATWGASIPIYIAATCLLFSALLIHYYLKAK